MTSKSYVCNLISSAVEEEREVLINMELDNVKNVISTNDRNWCIVLENEIARGAVCTAVSVRGKCRYLCHTDVLEGTSFQFNCDGTDTRGGYTSQEFGTAAKEEMESIWNTAVVIREALVERCASKFTTLIPYHYEYTCGESQFTVTFNGARCVFHWMAEGTCIPCDRETGEHIMKSLRLTCKPVCTKASFKVDGKSAIIEVDMQSENGLIEAFKKLNPDRRMEALVNKAVSTIINSVWMQYR